METIIDKILPVITTISLNKKYKTVKGEDVRILVTDKAGFAPVVGLIKRDADLEELMCWKANGTPVIEGLYDSDTLMEIIKEIDPDVFQCDELIMYQWGPYKNFVPGFYRGAKKDVDPKRHYYAHYVYGKSLSSWGDKNVINAYAVRKPTKEEFNKFLPDDSLFRKLIT